VLSIL